MLDVSDRLAVIIGGGRVATRKAIGLIECNAKQIRAIAPEFDPAMPAQVLRIAESYQPAHLAGANLAFAATNLPAVNAQVVADARLAGILACRCDEGEPGGDFVTPARFRESDVIVSVSAGSAALSAAMRDELKRQFDPRYAKMASAMATLRPIIRDAEPSADARRKIFHELTGPEALATLDAGGIDALRGWMTERHPGIKF